MALILCVDDHPDNIKLLSLDLHDAGYQVATADSGETCLDYLAQHSPDLVILDVMMPGINGLEVLTRIRQTRGPLDLPIIMATALDEAAHVVDALEKGANDYVTKPLEASVVLARVATHVQLSRLSREAAELGRMRDEFLAIASHDLKNPLVSVLGFARLLEATCPVGTPLTPKGHAMFGKIAVAAERMQRIVEDFVDFGAMESGKLKLTKSPVSLPRIARDAVASHHARAAAKGVEIVEEIADVAPLPADGARIGQVVDNLVGNAVKFCKAGDKVAVKVGVVEQQTVKVEVADNGPGLSPSDLTRVFGKFARLSNSPTGGEKSSGLGLWICQQLVQAHGGHIGVANNVTGGATFWFTLPVGDDRAA